MSAQDDIRQAVLDAQQKLADAQKKRDDDIASQEAERKRLTQEAEDNYTRSVNDLRTQESASRLSIQQQIAMGPTGAVLEHQRRQKVGRATDQSVVDTRKNTDEYISNVNTTTDQNIQSINDNYNSYEKDINSYIYDITSYLPSKAIPTWKYGPNVGTAIQPGKSVTPPSPYIPSWKMGSDLNTAVQPTGTRADYFDKVILRYASDQVNWLQSHISAGTTVQGLTIDQMKSELIKAKNNVQRLQRYRNDYINEKLDIEGQAFVTPFAQAYKEYLSRPWYEKAGGALIQSGASGWEGFKDYLGKQTSSYGTLKTLGIKPYTPGEFKKAFYEPTINWETQLQQEEQTWKPEDKWKAGIVVGSRYVAQSPYYQITNAAITSIGLGAIYKSAPFTRPFIRSGGYGMLAGTGVNIEKTYRTKGIEATKTELLATGVQTGVGMLGFGGGLRAGGELPSIGPAEPLGFTEAIGKPVTRYAITKTPKVLEKIGEFTGNKFKPVEWIKPIGETERGLRAQSWARGGEEIKPLVASARYGIGRTKGFLTAKQYIPQQFEFQPEVISGEKQFIRMGEEEYYKPETWGRGGVHATTAYPKEYFTGKTLAEEIDSLRIRKAPEPLNTVFKGTEDNVILQFAKDNDLIYSGSGAMKVQTKFSIAKVRRFWGKTPDKDFLFDGTKEQTGIVTQRLADDLARQTGKTYKVSSTSSEVHTTYHIKDSTGKTIIDITTNLPQTGFIGPGKRMPLTTTTIEGLRVANLDWLFYNKVEIAALRGVQPLKNITKAITDINVMSKGKYPEMILKPSFEPGESTLYGRGLSEKVAERFRSQLGVPKSEFVAGYGTREGPQVQTLHESPRGMAVRWPMGLETENVEYSYLRTGLKYRPELYVNVKPGLSDEVINARLLRAAQEGPDSYLHVRSQIVKEFEALGKTTPRMPTYKLLLEHAAGNLAEPEAGYPTGTKFNFGYKPGEGRISFDVPQPKSPLAKAYNWYGEQLAKFFKTREFTIDTRTGRTILMYPTEPIQSEPITYESTSKTPVGERILDNIKEKVSSKVSYPDTIAKEEIQTMIERQAKNVRYESPGPPITYNFSKLYQQSIEQQPSRIPQQTYKYQPTTRYEIPKYKEPEPYPPYKISQPEYNRNQPPRPEPYSYRYTYRGRQYPRPYEYKYPYPPYPYPRPTRYGYAGSYTPKPMIASSQTGQRREIKPTGGYIPLVKRDATKKLKARWVPVSKKPLPYEQALGLGAQVVDVTVSRTFKVVKAKAPPVSVPAYESLWQQEQYKFRPKIKKGVRQANPPYIEKTQYAIDMPGEFRGITVEGWKAIQRKKQYNQFVTSWTPGQSKSIKKKNKSSTMGYKPVKWR